MPVLDLVHDEYARDGSTGRKYPSGEKIIDLYFSQLVLLEKMLKKNIKVKSLVITLEVVYLRKLALDNKHYFAVYADCLLKSLASVCENSWHIIDVYEQLR